MKKKIFFTEIILSKRDILLLSGTKIDEPFPNSQFFVEGYRVVRRDRNMTGRGFLLYLKDNIPSWMVNTSHCT